MNNDVKSERTSTFLWWVISPTFKYAEYLKNKIPADQKNDLKVLIIKNNQFYFLSAFFLCAVAQALTSWIEWSDGIIVGICVALFSWFYLCSRATEIFKAFLTDAIDILDDKKPSSNLTYGDRLKLAFKSYVELILIFAIFYFIVPKEYFSFSCEGFSSIFEAIYFSGVTITTLGYGDINPVNTLVQLATVYQVLVGFSLIIVSFTIYTSKGLNKEGGPGSAV